jgi:thiosulfate reductase/polysulfide reductase chain A
VPGSKLPSLFRLTFSQNPELLTNTTLVGTTFDGRLRGSNKMMNQTNDEQGIETKNIICWASPGCSSSCGVLVRVKDGKIISMRGNPEFPGSQGAVCSQRFPHLNKWLGHPDQLMYPLKRRGERGENNWERISWDQALDEIAAKLKQLRAEYGAETLSIIEGT